MSKLEVKFDNSIHYIEFLKTVYEQNTGKKAKYLITHKTFKYRIMAECRLLGAVFTNDPLDNQEDHVLGLRILCIKDVPEDFMELTK